MATAAFLPHRGLRTHREDQLVQDRHAGAQRPRGPLHPARQAAVRAARRRRRLRGGAARGVAAGGRGGGRRAGRAAARTPAVRRRPRTAPDPMANFRLHGTRVLAVDLAGDAVKAKNGAMVAYDGEMTFKKMTGGGEGLRGLVTRRITGEAMAVMEVKGHGTCYFADRATEINLVRAERRQALRRGEQPARHRAGAAHRHHLHRAARRLPGQRAVHHHRRGHRPGRDHVRRAGDRAAGHRADARSSSTPARTSRTPATCASSSRPRSAGAR